MSKQVDAEQWLKEVMDDLTSIIQDDPDALSKRNERFGAYLVYLTTLVSRYRFIARNQRDLYEKDTPRPDKGVKQWEEARDSRTASARYYVDFLSSLREDLQTRISLGQTALNWHRQNLHNAGT